jgi:outer membrane biosynthesis protein TonB
MIAAMQRFLVLLVACGGTATTPETPSNRTTTDDTLIEIEVETLGGQAESKNAVARRQAIAQARSAGILGPKGPEAHLSKPLDKSSIKAAVKTRIDSIQVCYEIALLDKPGLHGTTTVDFTIGGDGSVVTATGRGFDPEVDQCVADAIKSILFSKPSAPKVNVRYPFTFKPAS